VTLSESVWCVVVLVIMTLGIYLCDGILLLKSLLVISQWSSKSGLLMRWSDTLSVSVS
jgi:hypothetical protein